MSWLVGLITVITVYLFELEPFRLALRFLWRPSHCDEAILLVFLQTRAKRLLP